MESTTSFLEVDSLALDESLERRRSEERAHVIQHCINVSGSSTDRNTDGDREDLIMRRRQCTRQRERTGELGFYAGDTRKQSGRFRGSAGHAKEVLNGQRVSRASIPDAILLDLVGGIGFSIDGKSHIDIFQG